jgi:hypothetical protein
VSRSSAMIHNSTDILHPLRHYFAAVNDNALPKSEKVAGIAKTFSATGTIIDQNGRQWVGTEQIKNFYGSESSPVCTGGFCATPHVTTALCSNSIIVVEINLHSSTGDIRVGDWFEFDAHGLITSLRVYKAAPIQPV